jgi:DNA modification methylase
MKQLGDNSIPLTVTSPPYFAYKDYGKIEGNIENLETYEKYVEYFNDWFKELYRITEEDGRVCIIIDDKHTNLKTEGVNKNRGTHARFILLAEKYGFQYKDLIIWAKARAGHASGGADKMLGSYPYPPNIPCVSWFEYVLIFRKQGNPRIQRITQTQKELSKLSMNEFKWACESIWKIQPENIPVHIPKKSQED